MESPLIGSKIFTRYHQQQAQLYREDNRYRSDDGGSDGIYMSPTRRRADFIPKKTAASNNNTRQTETSSADYVATSSDANNSSDRHDADYIVDDLTMGYSASPQPRFTTERNPVEDTGSGRSFRITSLDGCHEEEVSPLFPYSSSTSVSSLGVPNIPMIPGPTIASLDGEAIYITKWVDDATIPKATTTTSKLSAKMDENSNTTINDPEKKTTPASKQRRRGSNHNRSQFVFDGNLSFAGSISPCSMYGSPTRMCIPSPSRFSLPDLSMVKYHAFDVGSHSNEKDNEDDNCDTQQESRKTPPPSHQEQRRRNRAMPSMQYETTILNKLRQRKQQHNLRQQNTW